MASGPRGGCGGFDGASAVVGAFAVDASTNALARRAATLDASASIAVAACHVGEGACELRLEPAKNRYNMHPLPPPPSLSTDDTKS